MTPSRARIARGRETAQFAARWFRENGWPHAQAKPGASNGQDIDNMPGLSPEVKATDDMPLLAALRQALANAAGAIPFVVWRPNGYGPAIIGTWVAALRLSDFTTLLRDAGYGDTLITGHEWVQHRDGRPPRCACGATRVVKVYGDKPHTEVAA